jgi:hypothetical protein
MSRDSKGLHILNTVAVQALADDDFREGLLADPKGVLGAAGLDVPDEVEVVIHENAADVIHLVLPARLPGEEDLEINEIDLIRISVQTGF